MAEETHSSYGALREGVGVADRLGVGRLEILGADRQRFVSGLVTCDVKALRAGQGCYGFFTSGQGKILADVVVLALEDRLWLEVPAGKGEEIAGHLRKYLVADRVEVRALEDVVPILVVGERAAALLAEAGVEGLPEDVWGHRAVRLAVAGEVEARVVRQGRCGIEALALWVSGAASVPVQEWLIGRGAVPLGLEALEVVRVEAGIGRFGADFGPANFPQETGAEAEAVSYTKGCYLGQEIVARIHYRGGVQNGLRGLVFSGETPPEPGTSLVLAEPEGEREVGRVGSAVASPRFGRTIGLGILHRRGWEPGTRLRVASGGEAEVVALPFE